MQAAISASQAAAVGGKVAQIYIPTPETNQSTIQYDQLYPSRFSQPATYIRFSSTVEECIGTQYCMNREDDVYLKIMNQKAWAQSPCSEDQFEQIMDFFEQFSRSRQPFAAVDNAAVIGLDDMMQAVEFHESVEEVARSFAKDIYVHWKNKRAKRGNKPLIPQLKVCLPPVQGLYNLQLIRIRVRLVKKQTMLTPTSASADGRYGRFVKRVAGTLRVSRSYGSFGRSSRTLDSLWRW